MKDLFLVIENTPALTLDSTYRVMLMRGCTYSEEGLRKWINRVWEIPVDESLSSMTAAARKGGWTIYRCVSPE